MSPAGARGRPGRRPIPKATMTQTYYETMYILRPDIPEEEVETHVTKYRDLVIEAGGEVIDTQMRGKRRLAYSIAKHREGIYVQLNHNGDGQQVASVERAMRLSEDVIRYLTVKQDGPLPTSRAAAASTEGSEGN
jgi:small subunit ribosomal protein S6